VAFVRDGAEEGDKLAGISVTSSEGNKKSFRCEHEVSQRTRTV